MWAICASSLARERWAPRDGGVVEAHCRGWEGRGTRSKQSGRSETAKSLAIEHFYYSAAGWVDTKDVLEDCSVGTR